MFYYILTIQAALKWRLMMCCVITLNFTLRFPKLLQFCKVFVQDEDFGEADGRHFSSAGSFLFFVVVVAGLPTNVDRTSRRCTQFGFDSQTSQSLTTLYVFFLFVLVSNDWDLLD